MFDAAAEHRGHPMVVHVELVESGHRPQTRERRVPLKGDLDPPRAHANELGERADRHKIPFADDPDAIADVLHLGEDVRREEYRRPGFARLPHELVKDLLVERI